jgi:2-methylaconitate cis-trans-isomerase PrpF
VKSSAVLSQDDIQTADIGMAGASAIPAAFLRGGTSKGLFFLERDLPDDRRLRDALFLRALGSPDPEGRQLDGMGGGLSSLSKVVIVRPSRLPGVDLDYEFAQIAIKDPEVDYTGNCGNLTSAVGEFAASENLVARDWSSLTLFNINTRKYVRLTIEREMASGAPSGRQPIAVRFLDVGGETTGQMFPLGPRRLQLPFRDHQLDVTIIDAAAPLVILALPELDLGAPPDQLESSPGLLVDLETLRQTIGRSMGLGSVAGAVPVSNPSLALIGPSQAFSALDGRRYASATHHLTARFVNMGRIHRAAPMTGAIAVAVASMVPGTIPAGLRTGGSGVALHLAHPAGVLPLQVVNEGGRVDVTITRTARRLMSGFVHV